MPNLLFRKGGEIGEDRVVLFFGEVEMDGGVVRGRGAGDGEEKVERLMGFFIAGQRNQNIDFLGEEVGRAGFLEQSGVGVKKGVFGIFFAEKEGEEELGNFRILPNALRKRRVAAEGADEGSVAASGPELDRKAEACRSGVDAERSAFNQRGSSRIA